MEEKLYEYYLNCNIDELKKIEVKKKIINNEDKNQFVWFCQNATEGRINKLLDNEGIKLLLQNDEYGLIERLNGLVTSGKDFSILKNEEICEVIFKKLGTYYMYALGPNAGMDYIKFIADKHPEEIVQTFSNFPSETQQYLYDNYKFDISTLNECIYYCDKDVSERIMQERPEISLDNVTFTNIMRMTKNEVRIPQHLFTKKLLLKICQINDVNTYRNLIENLEKNNDTSIIERGRKKYYEMQLATVGENGLLPNYKKLKENLNNPSKNTMENLKEILGDMYSSDDILYKFIVSHIYEYGNRNKDSMIQKLNNYEISNMIIDYFFEEIPTNVLADMKMMINYQNQTHILSEEDEKLYKDFIEIDKKTPQERIEIFKRLKDKDLMTKFYDDYNLCKDKMIENINSGIINEENISKYKDDSLSKLANVPIYVLSGEPFYALVRCIKPTKNRILDKIETFSDGESYSIDSSNLLSTFKDPKIYYTIAYSGIPEKQLVHIFPTDSFSGYQRNEKNLPPEGRSTSRISYLSKMENIINESKNYNELIIATPNKRKYDEFNNSLKSPKPIAIYCYDTVTKEDIESAKKLGLGIIVVNTKSYNLKKDDKKLGLKDTMDPVTSKSKYNYISSSKDDEKRVIDNYDGR